MNVSDLKEKLDRIRAEIGRAVIGQDDVVEHTLIAVLARGHVLLEGAPGLGKTLLVRTLGARARLRRSSASSSRPT